jgi:hypothetical protein
MNMKYQIEVKRFKDNEWRQYTIHNTYIGAWFKALKGRTWANFLLWLNGSDKRVETRIVEVDDVQE